MSKESSAQTSEIEIGSSIMSMFDASTIYTAAWPVRAFADITNEAGYNGGLEWHPVRGMLAGIQVKSGLVNLYEKESIQSLHQSWREEKSLGDVLHHPNKPLALISYVLLPERVKSLNDLQQLQETVGRELPVVLYPPSKLGEESGTDRNFGEKLFQPTAEIMQAWNVRSVSELIGEMTPRGYTGLCLDLFHMRRPYDTEVNLDPWQETLPQLLPYTKEIHVAAGRVDIGQDRIDTEAELRDLLQGTVTTEMSHMLQEIAKTNWTGRVVTEVPAMALHQNRKNAGRFTTINQLVADHKQLVTNIHALLA